MAFLFFSNFFDFRVEFCPLSVGTSERVVFNSDKEQLFRCSLKIEYQVHRTSVLMISHFNGYAKTSVWNEREPPL